VKVIGASFDPPDANLAFAQKYDYFGTLLSDADRTAGRDYETVRAPEEASPEYAKRRTYIIDPDGVIRKAFRVTDIQAHPQEVLDALQELMHS